MAKHLQECSLRLRSQQHTTQMLLREVESKENIASARRVETILRSVVGTFNSMCWMCALGLCRKFLECVGSFYNELSCNEWVQLTFTPKLCLQYYVKGDLYLYSHTFLILKLVCDKDKWNQHLFTGYRFFYFENINSLIFNILQYRLKHVLCSC